LLATLGTTRNRLDATSPRIGRLLGVSSAIGKLTSGLSLLGLRPAKPYENKFQT
jgi:hypothetical protein